MSTKQLWELFEARHIDLSSESKPFADFRDYWNNTDSQHVDQRTESAMAILSYVKAQYEHQKASSGPLAIDQAPPLLEPYFNDAGAIQDFLLELFDPELPASYGPAFHEDCELIYREFTSKETRLTWTRAEYINIKLYLERTSEPAIITGQPGIGKTFLLNYLLVARLRQQKPVLYYPPQRKFAILFDGGEQYEVNRDQFSDHAQYTGLLKDKNHERQFKDLWILIDSLDFNLEVPSWALNILPKVIYSSSPTEKRWTGMEQAAFFPAVVIMNPYGLREAQLLMILEMEVHGIPKEQKRTQLERCTDFYQWSPTPRAFIDKARVRKWDIKRLHRQSEVAVNELDTDQIRQLGHFNEVNWSHKGLCHKLILVERRSEFNNFVEELPFRMEHEIKLLNAVVIAALRKKLDDFSRMQTAEWFRLTLGDPSTRSVAGFLWQYRLHSHWKEEGKIVLQVQTAYESKSSSSGAGMYFDLKTTSTLKDVKIVVKSVHCDPLPSLEELEHNVLYYPPESNFPAIDFIIRDAESKKYYGISATVAQRHGVSKKIKDILKKGQVPSTEYVHLFVTNLAPGGDNHLVVPCEAKYWSSGFPFEVGVAWLQWPRKA